MPYQSKTRVYSVDDHPIRKTNLEQEKETKTSLVSMAEKTTAAKEILNEICSNMDGESYELVSQDNQYFIHALP